MNYSQAIETAKQFFSKYDIPVTFEQTNDFAVLILEASLADIESVESINEELSKADTFQ